MRFAYVMALAAVIACAGTAGADPDAPSRKPALSKKPPRTPKSRPAPPDDDSPAWLGIEFDPTAPGVLVAEVLDGTAAARVGLRAGDRLLAVDGVALISTDDLVFRIRRHRVGDAVKVAVARGT